MTNENNPPISLVISSSDEGVQLNSGTRIGFVGSGYDLPHFSKAVKSLKKHLPLDLKMASSQEDDWLLEKLESKNPNLYRETVEKLAKEEDVKYIGQLDFGDPRALDDEVTKGHLVRPPKIHVADSICFTCGGGEQVFNLRNIVLSADFANDLTTKQLGELMQAQIDFYKKVLNRDDLTFVIETDGILGKKLAEKNQAALMKALPEIEFEV
ncbi:MAG: hypothetical protein LBG64_03935 [Pseudomonadales bacterium]|jgi:hypothetical protein|nr:hypothetical protein [Pseudomonadales bacterium]